MKFALEGIKSNWKRYLLSSLITFLGAFLLVIYMEIDNITTGSFRDGTVWGIVFVAVRAGTKALIELFLFAVGLLKK